MGNDDRWRREHEEREYERTRNRNRGMFGYEGEGYMEGARGPWDEQEARSADRWSGGRSSGPAGRWNGEAGDRWNAGRSDWHQPADYDVDRERERSWRMREEMPDRASGGRELERYIGRDEVSDRGASRGRDDRDLTRDTMERASFRGLGPRGYQRSDERLHEEVCERLAWDHDVDASDIDVAVAGGTVTLTGTVHDRRMKRRAEDVAESVRGVADVQNHLHIDRDSSNRGRDEEMQSGVLGLTTTENLDDSAGRERGAGTGGHVTGGRVGSASLPMASAAAASAPITNPGAVSTGSSTSGGVSPNQGITSGNTSVGDRARRRNR